MGRWRSHVTPWSGPDPETITRFSNNVTATTKDIQNVLNCSEGDIKAMVPAVEALLQTHGVTSEDAFATTSEKIKLKAIATNLKADLAHAPILRWAIDHNTDIGLVEKAVFAIIRSVQNSRKRRFRDRQLRASTKAKAGPLSSPSPKLEEHKPNFKSESPLSLSGQAEDYAVQVRIENKWRGIVLEGILTPDERFQKLKTETEKRVSEKRLRAGVTTNKGMQRVEEFIVQGKEGDREVIIDNGPYLDKWLQKAQTEVEELAVVPVLTFPTYSSVSQEYLLQKRANYPPSDSFNEQQVSPPESEESSPQRTTSTTNSPRLRDTRTSRVREQQSVLAHTSNELQDDSDVMPSSRKRRRLEPVQSNTVRKERIPATGRDAIEFRKLESIESLEVIEGDDKEREEVRFGEATTRFVDGEDSYNADNYDLILGNSSQPSFLRLRTTSQKGGEMRMPR